MKKDFGKEGNSQPYILILGGTMLKPQQTFVIIEHRALEQTSLIKAVDVCFKAFYVFDLQYPEKCSGVWEFISAIVYDLAINKLKCHAIREFRAYCSSHE